MSPEEFERLVDEALDGLPQGFKEKIDNVSVVVEDYPSAAVLRGFEPPRPGRFELLGVYIGVPITRRPGHEIMGKLPDRIELYQKNIESYCRNDREIVRQIRATVIHEVGHYFGLDEEQLRELEE
ncbi:MAG: metallopeptidase family protein [Candidatus Edwardsbacteria bacterium]|jgi:predicted Zn-dependent protease with MMP-like domain|nr:metallopeptidase family protein [Candidatus Edwardsbacteria bacterium]